MPIPRKGTQQPKKEEKEEREDDPILNEEDMDAQNEAEANPIVNNLDLYLGKSPVTSALEEARIRILEDKVKELQLVIDKIPLSDIDNVTLKYRCSKKRWKFNPKNEEPDFLMTERVLKWTESELIRRGVN